MRMLVYSPKLLPMGWVQNDGLMGVSVNSLNLWGKELHE